MSHHPAHYPPASAATRRFGDHKEGSGGGAAFHPGRSAAPNVHELLKGAIYAGPNAASEASELASKVARRNFAGSAAS